MVCSLTISPFQTNSLSSSLLDPDASTASKDTPTPRHSSRYAPIECLLSCFLKRCCISGSTCHLYSSSGLVISRTSPGSIEIPSFDALPHFKVTTRNRWISNLQICSESFCRHFVLQAARAELAESMVTNPQRSEKVNK